MGILHAGFLGSALVIALATAATADPKGEVLARLDRADERIRARDHAGASAEIDAAARLAGDDFQLRYAVAHQRATLAAYRGDHETAAIQLLELLPEAQQRPTEPSAFWLHNTLMMIRQAQGDVPSALVECEEMTRAGRSGRWGKAAEREQLVTLKELWHRAYLLRMLAEQQREPRRATTLRYAEAAREAYRKAAPQPDYRDAVAVLDGYFAALAGDRTAALAAAQRVDIEENGDLEDLYLAAVAFEAGGDRVAAKKVRDKIATVDTVYIGAAIMRDFIQRDAAGGRFTPRHPARRP